MTRVIAGDIGGTHSRLMLAEVKADRIEVKYEQSYYGRDFSGFEPLLQQFLEELEASVDAACFAVAGPVKSNRASLTNLPWQLDAMQLTTRFGIPRIRLINDFAANGYSLAVLAETDYLVLQTGVSVAAGDRVMLGAGTGLGMALVTESQAGLRVHASEGGHMDFAPLDAEQRELLVYLQHDNNRISYEHVLSGPGLARLYRYCAWRDGRSAQDILSSADPAAAISTAALSGSDPVAAAALKLFFRVYGSCAANLALVGLATGGVYLAGGIAARLADALADSEFIEVFNNKPPMRDLLEAMPVKLITNPRAGLLGAAWYAGNQTG